MNWSSFRPHGEDPRKAFEAFSCLLFDRWCRREYGDSLLRVVFANGSGGDGGIEAYAELQDGAAVGLQAKWFRQPLKDAQIQQIERSISTARTVHRPVARYIVAIPRDLGVKTRRPGKSERERWDELKRNSSRDFALDLWDDTRLTGLMAELGGDGLQRYWFGVSTVDLADLKKRYQQALAGWLRKRYQPDLHQVGQIESDLRCRLEGPATAKQENRDLQRNQSGVEDVYQRLAVLHLLPEFIERPGAAVRLRETLRYLDVLRDSQETLGRLLSPGSSFPVRVPDEQALEGSPEIDALRALLTDDSSSAVELRPTQPAIDALERLEQDVASARSAWQSLREYGYPVVFVGEPGAGKTHALSHAVETCIDTGCPALLLRGREIDPCQPWDEILRRGLGEPTWSLNELLDAIEASVAQATVRRTIAERGAESCAPARALIVIDGLDESVRPERWTERLGELTAFAAEYPRVLFACSLRPSLASRIDFPPGLAVIYIRESDSDIHSIFRSYCKANAIEAPPLLRWILGSPLAVRLFAEQYRGQTISQVQPDGFLITKLFDEHLKRLDDELRGSSEIGWSHTLSPARDVIRAVVDSYIENQRGLTTNEALDVAETAQRVRDVLSRSTLLWVLEGCRDAGFLLEQPDFDGTGARWEPAYQRLTDYILASRASEEALARTVPERQMPPYLRGRHDAQIMAVALLLSQGQDLLDAGRWLNLDSAARERLQLSALRFTTAVEAQKHADWVTSCFKRDMPTCRFILQEVVVPGLRVPSWPYNALFVQSILKDFSVAQRDFFWSGPSHLPGSSGAPWEGWGAPVIEELCLVEDDAWDTAPLLLCWATSTVNNENRERIRLELARWGIHNSPQMPQLLRTVLDSNDPQMREDLLGVGYAVATIVQPKGDWWPLAQWLLRTILTPGSREYSKNVVIRHYASALVEVIAEAASEDSLLAPERLPGCPQRLELTPLLPPLDEEVIRHLDGRLGTSPANLDLAWYVIPAAIEPFFRPGLSSTTARGALSISENLGGVSAHILEEFAKGKLRHGAHPAVRHKALEELDWRDLHREESRGLDAEDLRHLLESIDRATIGESEDSPGTKELPMLPPEEPPAYSSEAQHLLDKVAALLGLSSVTPERFAFSFVQAFVTKLGWNEKTHSRQAGADAAIHRKYPRASHGSRSSISSFGEKYVWLACHELQGYLADRLPINDWGVRYPAPVDPGRLAEIVSPAASILLVTKERDALPVPELVSPIALQGRTLVDRANEWAESGPHPLLRPTVVPPCPLLPDSAQGEWTVLRLRAKATEPESQAIAAVWMSCGFVSSDELELLWEDARSCDCRLALEVLKADMSTGVSRLGSYADPIDALRRPPWLTEIDDWSCHTTVDSAGSPISVKIRPAASQILWKGPSGERDLWLPSEVVRQNLAITRVCGDTFYDEHDKPAAIFHESGSAWGPAYADALLCRRSVVAELRERGLEPIWSLRLFREPAAHLIQREWPRTRFDWHGVARERDQLEIVETNFSVQKTTTRE